MPAQIEKAHAFRALHERDKAFIIPNPWDIGTARMLSSLGFQALAPPAPGSPFRGVAWITGSIAMKCWRTLRRWLRRLLYR